MTLRVIIPLKNRPEIKDTVYSLVSSGIENLVVIIVDFNSNDIDTISNINEICNYENVNLITVNSEFSRSKGINVGLNSAEENDLVLASDADIIWNSEALLSLVSLTKNTNGFVHISSVEETIPCSENKKHHKLRPFFNSVKCTFTITIDLDSCNNDLRSGTGLICGRLNYWKVLNGYNLELTHWGWEDYDFITRAVINNLSIDSVGSVKHMTHSDLSRDIVDGKTKQESRDNNIITSSKLILKNFSKNKGNYNRNIFEIVIRCPASDYIDKQINS